MNLGTKLLFVCVSSFSTTTLASVKTHLKITQIKNHLSIEAEIKTQETRIFRLQKEALINNSEGLTVLKKADGSFELKATAKQAARISYDLNIDLKKVNYFLEDQNWYPHESNESIQEFGIDVSSEPGFFIVHSAIGKSPEGISLVFGAFTKYMGSSNKINIYLQNPDQALANTLITNLEKYLKLFEEKIGPYPYQDFSVVESSDEIGYAFPRMTWIGSKLLRFPFILTTSLPHELLHSWWGNGVFVDHELGNWCEGLTTYGADYGLLDEKSKRIYRRRILTDYADYVKSGTEISLAQFVSRGEDKSLQAIGYGKSAMMFIMLEDLVTTSNFNKTLKSFYKNFKSKKATYRDFFNEVQANSDIEASVLNHFYDQWVTRTGAVSWQNLNARIRANQTSVPTDVEIQMPVTDAERLQGLSIDLSFRFPNDKATSKRISVQPLSYVKLKSTPMAFTIDADFRIFRLLADAERPLNFSRFFGGSTAQIFANQETVSAAKAVFSKLSIQTLNSLDEIQMDQTGNLLIENYNGGNHVLNAALASAGVQLKENSILIQSEEISLESNAYFVSVPVGSKLVIFFKLNGSLPTNRWFERWVHYGAQGYVVLTSTSALKQGVQDSVFERRFLGPKTH